MNLPPIATLRCFEAVARLGSVTDAAGALHVTHSAVSQQLRQLESSLGKILFLRQGRGLQLTENGRLYALHVRTILRELEDATRLVRSRPNGDELVVTTLPSFGQQWLVPRLPRFRKMHPDLRIRLQVGLELAVSEHGAADLGIRMGQGQWPGLAQQELFSDEWVAIVAPAFDGGGWPRSAEEILEQPLVRCDESWQDWCDAAGVDVPTTDASLWINDSNLIIEAVRRGHGIAIERLSLVAEHLRQGTLVQACATRARYDYPYWLVWPQHAVQDRHAAFREWLVGEVQAYAAGLPWPK